MSEDAPATKLAMVGCPDCEGKGRVWIEAIHLKSFGFGFICRNCGKGYAIRDMKVIKCPVNTNA